MATLTSTVNAAISTLLDHFQTVATQSVLKVTVYDGIPIEYATDNVLMVGHYETGQQVTYDQDWAAFPASVGRKSEQYQIQCSLKVWSGDSSFLAPAARRDEAWALLDAVMSELQSDPLGSGVLSPSGSWQVTHVDNPETGPLSGSGWGVIYTFTVDVINVRLYAS